MIFTEQQEQDIAIKLSAMAGGKFSENLEMVRELIVDLDKESDLESIECGSLRVEKDFNCDCTGCGYKLRFYIDITPVSDIHTYVGAASHSPLI